MYKNIVSYSGGKDSGATCIRYIEEGRPFRLVFADTGNEHQITYDFVHEFADRIGIELETVTATFPKRLYEKKIETCMSKWLWDGVPPWRIRQAIEVLKTFPTGNPFLDLCAQRGRFPSTRARFCSVELKQEIIFNAVVDPLLEQGIKVISAQGVRADESKERANLPDREAVGGGLFIHRPIIKHTADDVIKMHKRHNLPLNPLYRLGCSRVGCMPCIHSAKAEIKNMAERFPEEVERLKEWEEIIGKVSKRGVSTFFAADKTPGRGDARSHIDAVIRWSKTTRGGRLLPLFPEEIKPCSSIYGLCE